MPAYHLAQANIARMRAPLEDPIMNGFVAQLEYINSVADRSSGFVWRLQTEDGDATAIRVFDDDSILFNMSVWESVEALHEYVYRSDHRGALRQRKEWFLRMDRPAIVLWWVPAGHRPTVPEARDRLAALEQHGPTAEAFTFQQWFPPPGSSDAPRPSRRTFEGCEWGA